MFLARLVVRLWLLHLGLWGSRSGVLHHPSSHSHSTLPALYGGPEPLVGVAVRQGRRFGMEDRTALDSGRLLQPGAANYTFVAVYDGHEGSAASQHLAARLHPAVRQAVEAAWAGRRSLLQPQLQAALAAAAERLNQGLLEAAAAGTAAAGEDDGDDAGSTAVFAVLVGTQLLVGNVGNSRALLCTSGSTALSRLAFQDAAAAAPHTNTSSSSSSSSSSRSSNTAVMPHAAAAANNQQHQQDSGALSAVQPLQSHCAAAEDAVADTAAAAAVTGSSDRCDSERLRPLLLTHDHTPAWEREAARVAEAGGFVAAKRPGGKLRVGGELEVTRSFGDAGFVDQGVIAAPEFTLASLAPGDALLVLASDGLFEVLSPAEVCSHAQAVVAGPHSPGALGSTPSPPPALALPGETAAADAGAADSSSEHLTGCCDCSRQQQWQASVPEVWTAFEAQGVWRQRRRLEAAQRAALRSRLKARARQAAAASASAADGAAVAGEDLQPAGEQGGDDRVRLMTCDSQQQQQPTCGAAPACNMEVEEDDDKDSTTTSAAASAGQAVGDGGDYSLEAPLFFSDSGAPLDADCCVAATVGGVELPECPVPDGHEAHADSSCDAPAPDACDNLGPLEECYEDVAGDAEQARADGDTAALLAADLGGVADMSSTYCRRPAGTPAPYSLPQAVAVRLVDEAYNRLSMDNIAAVVLDVRAVAAAAGGGGDSSVPAAPHLHKQQQLPQRAGAGARSPPKCAPKRSREAAHSSSQAAEEAAASAAAEQSLQLAACSVQPAAHNSSRSGSASPGAAQQGSMLLCDEQAHAGAGDAPTSGPQAARPAAPPHNYRLVQRVGSAATSQPGSHMHLHPLLGVDQVQLQQQQEKQSGWWWRQQQQDAGAWPSHSLIRHMDPGSMLLQLPPAPSSSSTSSSAKRELQCRTLLSLGAHKSAAEAAAHQHHLPQLPGVSSLDLKALPGSSTSSSSSTGGETGAHGFMSACLAGAAADPGTAVVQGGTGLSAVVAALAAVPLQHQEQQQQEPLALAAVGQADAAAGGGEGPSAVGLAAALTAVKWGAAQISQQGRSLLGLQQPGGDDAVASLPLVPDAAAAAGSTTQQQQQQYKLRQQVGVGHFGSVFLAVRTGGPDAGSSPSEQEVLVLKRVPGSRGGPVRRSGLREAYFGQLLQRQQRQQRQQQQQQQEAGEHVKTQAAAEGPSAVLGCSSAGPSLSPAELLAGHNHIVRFVEAFKTAPASDVWLVFKNEGASLHALMYEPAGPTVTLGGGEAGDTSSSSASEPTSGGLSLLGPSQWWLAARRDAATGHALVASVLHQLLQALAVLQAAGISHRDVKPENLLVTPTGSAAAAAAAAAAGEPSSSSNSSSSRQPDPTQLHLRLIDFGSALDAHSIASGLYGRVAPGVVRNGTGSSSSARSSSSSGGGAPPPVQGGPSLDEVTLEYAPPEVLFSSRYHHPLAAGPCQLAAFDAWSAGVVMLELVLGSPAVFAPSPATRAAVDKQLRLQGRPPGERQLLYLLRGLMELCVYPPRVTPTAAGGAKAQQQAGGSSVPLPWSCSEESLLQLIAGRDPVGRGLEGGLALRLLQRLLAWDPKRRPTAAQALRHAYFTAPRSAAAAMAGGDGGDAGGEEAGEDEEQQQAEAAPGSGQQRKRQRAHEEGLSGQQQQQQQQRRIRRLMQHQAAVLEACCRVPLGEPGWC